MIIEFASAHPPIRQVRKSRMLGVMSIALCLFSSVTFLCAGVAGQTAGEPKKSKTPAEAAASYFPNNVLITQDNKPVHFFDDLLRGRTVIINFMFTTCTGICPSMTANLAKVQTLLGDRSGKDVNIISISVDPAIDTPQTLKQYATKFGVKPGWSFLTGNKADVDVVLRKLGAWVEDKNQHSSILIVGNVETGDWTKMLAMSKPSDIVDNVLKLAGPKKN